MHMTLGTTLSNVHFLLFVSTLNFSFLYISLWRIKLLLLESKEERKEKDTLIWIVLLLINTEASENVANIKDKKER